MEYEQLTFDFISSDSQNESSSAQEDTWFDNEFILQDRIQKIQQIIGKYGEENFSISFSGGKDSTVLHYLIDMAIPRNRIPRVYANTGIELNMIRDFVFEMQKEDDRIVVIKPSVPIKPMLEKEGYPFKSKSHAATVESYQRSGSGIWVQNYLGIGPGGYSSAKSCPEILKYQFTPDFKIKISDKCCLRMKEEPLAKWNKEHGIQNSILGITRAEGGRRFTAKCLAWKKKKHLNFQPLAPVTKEWEEWFITTYNIKICEIYKEPYCFLRTGCKGCPFAIELQKELDIMEKFFPEERKQCEIIWGPVYEEYRRLGYRLRKTGTDQLDGQMSLFDTETT